MGCLLFVGQQIKFDWKEQWSFTVRGRSGSNELPASDWTITGRVPPSDLTKWHGGTDVVGYSVILQDSGGTAWQCWVAEGDFRITFDDCFAAKEKFGHYCGIFATHFWEVKP